jgi:alpha-beta hydrolase superfamily lysophospholipase
MGRGLVRRSESHVRPSGGVRLFRRAWLPAQPERVLLLVHGYAEHSGRYDPLGAWFAARDWAVHAYDHRGHGRSEGRRCHVDRFDQLLDDLDAMRQVVREEHPDVPLALVGHSMGGLVVTTYLCERDPPVQAAATSGALLELTDDLPSWRLWLARTLRYVMPRLSLASGLDPHGLSRDDEVVKRYLDDPLVHRRMTTAFAMELMGAVARTRRWPARVNVPLFLLHGEADPLCPISGSRAFHAGLHAKGSRIRTYPHLRHEIFNEPEHEQVFEDLHEWLSRACAARTDA